MISDGEASEQWKIQAPALAGAIRLAPTDEVKSFHLRGVSSDVLRDVASAYGIRAVVDDSVLQKNLRFDLENVNYVQAMKVLLEMTQAFAVPVDENSVLIARNNPASRYLVERQVEETICLPDSTQEQINELATMAREIFEVRQVTAQAASGSIMVRAPEEVLAPMNRTLQDLIDATGEVMVEVKIYEVDTTRTTNAGASIPTQAGIYNVDQAATALVNANQTLVQQAIAQGLGNPPITATSSALTIAGELIASGLVQSSLFNSTIGVIGGGTMMTGITETGNIAFNLGLNSTDTKALDDVQIRVGDRIGNAEARAVLGGGFDGGDDFRMRVAEDGRSPGADVINQFIAVHVPDFRAAGPVDEERIAAHRAERAHRRIDAAGNIFQRLGEQALRLRAIHADKLTTKERRNKAESE